MSGFLSRLKILIRDVEMEENKHKSKERSSIGNVEEKDVEQFSELNSNCCIYRLPQFLYKLNEKAYTPRLISIGPLHYGNKELMRMKSQKERYQTSFGRRVDAQALEELKTFIQGQQQFIRAHYSVNSNLPTSEYTEIILQDAIFIMELFLRQHENTDDFLLKSPIDSYITADLLVLENQLPYFLLNLLYSKVSPWTCRGVCPSFFTLFQNFFREYLFFNYVSFEKPPQQWTHFIDFLRCGLVMRAEPALGLGARAKDVIINLPCATELEKSGLKFKGTKDECLLNIKFARTKRYCKWLQWFEAYEVQIPTIEIYDETEILLRNLMAWEMFHYPRESHICSYVDLMDHLIDTKEDVDWLVKRDIIVNHVGDNEVIAKMFNGLCSHIVLSESCYSEISQKMIDHYKYPWNHFKATLKSGYFNNPWRGAATVAAVFLLLLTIAQTICSIIQIPQGYTK